MKLLFYWKYVQMINLCGIIHIHTKISICRELYMCISRQEAQELRKQGKYGDAVLIYNSIWENTKEFDQWLAWEYADSLKKINELDRCIEISTLIYKENPKFRINNDLLAWAIYFKYISTYNKDEGHSFNDLLEKAEFITSITVHKESSAYEPTVIKILKIIKKSNNPKITVLLYWLDKLNEDKINDKVYFAQEKEVASNLEFYFSVKTKVLIELKDYENCIIQCNKAFEKLQAFHYDNDIWLELRRLYSLGMLGNQEKATSELIKLATKKDHWSINATISQLYKDINKLDLALQYGCRACLTKDPPKMKINLYVNIGYLLEKQDNKLLALKHYLFSKQIREENQWNIPSELNTNINLLNSQYGIGRVSYNELKNFWEEQIKTSLPKERGEIITILPNCKAGFIKSNNESYYFKTSSIVPSQEEYSIGKKVEFSLVDSFDRKKQRETKEAVYIRVIG